MGDLTGVVALVTGASSGIGYAVATRLSQEGATVGLVARRAERLSDLSDLIAASGGRAVVIPADLTSSDQARMVVHAIVADAGRLDLVVNSAGVMLNGPSVSGPLDDWERMVDLNLKALMYVTKAALPHLLTSRVTSPRGVTDVVNISSIAARLPGPEVAIYNATKSGVNAATEAWRQEFTRDGVRFCVVEPGATETELFAQQPERVEHYERIFAGIEKLAADDVADAVAYAVTRPARVAVNHLVVRPREQV